MTMHRALRRGALVASLAAAIAVVSCAKDESAGQVTVVIQTDFAMPKDLDYFRLEVRSDGMPLGTDKPPPLYRNDYPVDPTAPPDLRVTIPATFAVYNTKGAVEPIAVRVSAGRKNEVRVLRDALTTVPADRNAMLRMYLQWLSDGSAVPPAPGAADPRAATSACPASQTNIAGICTDAHVDVATLPDFDATKVYGGASPAAGVGFDVLSCFAAPTTVVPDAACSFPMPAGAAPEELNVGIELPPGSDGVCNEAHCVVALDRQESPAGPAVGWSLAAGRVQLPQGVCTRAAVVPAMRVVVSAACAAKTSATPACGPPSAATDCSIHGTQDGAAPPPPGPAVAKRLSLGRDHTCVSTGSSVRCWGKNDFDQTGATGTPIVPLANARTSDFAEAVTAVSAGVNSTCAIAGSVFCWGSNRFGQRGTPAPMPAADDPRPAPMLVPPMGQPPIPVLLAVSSSASLPHACASGGGVAHCWGANGSYQLGDMGPGNGQSSNLSLDAKALALGDLFTCAVDTSKVVRCWGANFSGQLGISPSAAMPYGAMAPNGVPASTDVVAGGDFACALAIDKSVWCWGSGQSGVPTMTKMQALVLPRMVQPGVQAIAAGIDFVCAILAGPPETVRCWGNNTAGQLGVGNPATTVQDVVLPAGFNPPFDSVVAGGRRACVVAGKRVACWGSNQSGEIDDSSSPTETPHEVSYGL